MAIARFQVVSLPRAVPDYRPATPRHAKRLAAEPPAPARVQPRRFTWRFLAANNRSLATATEIFPDAASCIAAMEELKRGLADAACEFTRDESGLWRWTVRVDQTAAASSYSYRRQVRARITCDTFFALATDLSTSDNVQVVYR